MHNQPQELVRHNNGDPRTLLGMIVGEPQQLLGVLASTTTIRRDTPNMFIGGSYSTRNFTPNRISPTLKNEAILAVIGVVCQRWLISRKRAGELGQKRAVISKLYSVGQPLTNCYYTWLFVTRWSVIGLLLAVLTSPGLHRNGKKYLGLVKHCYSSTWSDTHPEGQKLYITVTT